MMDKFIYEYAIETIFNGGVENVTEHWDCPECGRSFIRISCARPHLRQDLLLHNERRGEGWKILTAVYPEFNMENSCDCAGDRPHLRIVREDDKES